MEEKTFGADRTVTLPNILANLQLRVLKHRQIVDMLQDEVKVQVGEVTWGVEGLCFDLDDMARRR